MRTLAFEKRADAPSPIGEDVPITGSITAAGQALFLHGADDPAEAHGDAKSRFGAGSPLPREVTARMFHLHVLEPGGAQRVDTLADIDLVHPFVDLFSDGGVLLVGARCRRRGPDDIDQNALVIDPGTGARTRFAAGDGIERVFIDEADRIWVGYFDEGVFGNFGWGATGDGDAEPIGSTGLNIFARDGEIIWRYPPAARHAISDCYALNVHGCAGHACVYMDFPFCSISEGFAVECTPNMVEGSHHIAVSDARVLFTGGYGDPHDVAHLARRGAKGLSDYEKVRLVMPDGDPPPPGLFVGRGPHLHHLSTQGWLSLSIEAL